MIVNERIYTLCAGKVPEYLQLFAAIRNKSMAVQIKILGNMLAISIPSSAP